MLFTAFYFIVLELEDEWPQPYTNILFFSMQVTFGLWLVKKFCVYYVVFCVYYAVEDRVSSLGIRGITQLNIASRL